MTTSNIKIYDSTGNDIDEFIIKDTIEFVTGRVCRGKYNVYYKGIGVPYSGHFTSNYDGYSTVKWEIPNNPFFKFRVEKPEFRDKIGIFQERYHPIFSEYIGACGIREGSLINNSVSFERSDVIVIDHIIYSFDSSQGYYKLLYRGERKTFLEAGSFVELIDTIKYMLSEGWNSPWDKDFISDISHLSTITDVADLFIAEDYIFRLGTVYSLLYSLSKRDVAKYIELVELIGVNGVYSFDIPVISARILDKWGFGDPSLSLSSEVDIYKALINGRNCCYGEYLEFGDLMKKHYLRDLEKYGFVVRPI